MCLNPIFLKGKYVSCRKCAECRIQYSNEWAYRCMLEASVYDCKSSLITLTYNEANLPEGGSLAKQDYQKFLKRLRKNLKIKGLKYFGCGEYGSKFLRPHYHIILFGYDFVDKFPFGKDKKGNTLYRSFSLEKCWKKGFSSIVDVSFDTVKYVAKYLQKSPPNGLLKPFLTMSKGIGKTAFKPDWLVSDKIYFNGKYIKIPRYFLDFLSNSDYNFLGAIDSLKEKRKRRMFSNFMVKDPNFVDPVFDLPTYENYIQDRRKKFEKIFGFIDF